jgi:cobalt-zinc-cadmium efflux system membrane fusion protein
VLLLAAACSGSGPTPAPAAERSRDFIRLDPGSPHLDFIKVEVVKESEAAPLVQLTGRVTFDEDHTQRLASPIDGRATEILVRPGDRVRAGQPLVELSSPQVGTVQADAQKAQSDLAVASKSVDRAHTLKADGAISDKEVAQAEADFRKAKADVARTSAQLKSLGISASEPTTNVALHSQVSGTVVDRTLLVGQEVRADQAAPLLTITNLETVWVLADVYEQDLGLVQAGSDLVVRVPAYPGVDFKGKVGHIGDVVDPATRTVKIRCVVPNPTARLKPEMFAKVELRDTSGRKVITISSKAVVIDGDKTKVLVASEGNTFRPRQVEVGPEVDGQVRVLGGLKPGEKIVTEGALFMKHELDTQ